MNTTTNGVNQMPIELIDTVSMPTWAMSYVFNSDASGITDEEQMLIDTWYASYSRGYLTIDILQDEDTGEDMEPDFRHIPEFGLACDCLDVNVYAATLPIAK